MSEILRKTVRLPKELVDGIEWYKKRNYGIMTDSVAIRMLIQKGLESVGWDVKGG